MKIFLQQVLNGLVIGSVYVLIALGLTLLWGILDIPNFAHGNLYMIGAYVTCVFVNQYLFGFFTAMIISMFIIAGVGILTEMLVFRPLRGTAPINYLIAALGLFVSLETIALLIWTPDPRVIETPFTQKVIAFMDLRITVQRLMIISVTIILIALLYLFVKKTMMGKAMRAMAQNREAAALLGINISRVSVISFAIASALAAAAGSLIGPIFQVYPTMGGIPIVKAFVIIILGGMGSIPGAILGGYILGCAEGLGAGYVSTAYKDAIGFGILIIVLMVKPSGIFGEVKR